MRIAAYQLTAFGVCALLAGTGLVSDSHALELPAEVLEDLRSEEFRTREAAQDKLLKWSRKQPAQTMDLLFDRSQMADDPEVRERCMAVLRELVNDEYLKEGEGYIGILMQDEIGKVPGDPVPRALIRVLQVVPDSPAHDAELKVNDLIAGLNERVWREQAASTSFREVVRNFKPGTRITLQVVRDGKLIEKSMKLARRPLIPETPFFDENQIDLEAAEKAAKEAFFNRWLEARKARD
jgi:hypothetical protein